MPMKWRTQVRKLKILEQCCKFLILVLVLYSSNDKVLCASVILLTTRVFRDDCI